MCGGSGASGYQGGGAGQSAYGGFGPKPAYGGMNPGFQRRDQFGGPSAYTPQSLFGGQPSGNGRDPSMQTGGTSPPPVPPTPVNPGFTPFVNPGPVNNVNPMQGSAPMPGPANGDWGNPAGSGSYSVGPSGIPPWANQNQGGGQGQSFGGDPFMQQNTNEGNLDRLRQGFGSANTQLMGSPIRAFGKEQFPMNPGLGGGEPVAPGAQYPQQPRLPGPGNYETAGMNPGMPQTGGQNYETAGINPMEQFAQQNASLLRPQTVMDPAVYGKAGQKPPPFQAPDTPMQPGQGGWEYGASPFANYGSPNSWQPKFLPGQRQYLEHMLGSYVKPGQRSQIDWNNAIGSVGNLSGIPFNSNMWS